MATVCDSPRHLHGERSTVVVIGVVAVRRVPPVDGFCVGGHAVEQAGDEFGVSAAAAGEAGLPEFCGGTVVVVDRLIRGIGVDLAGAVAVGLCPEVAEKPGQLRLVVGRSRVHARRGVRLWWP